MNQLSLEDISQWQNALLEHGFFVTKIDLPKELLSAVKFNNFQIVDQIMEKLLAKDGDIFNFLKSFFPDQQSIEHIISLRESKNEWEEDGIWHDDGSRKLAFSLSLTTKIPHGGVLEIRKKNAKSSIKIPTPEYGNIIVFQTGENGYEHKINKVIDGKRLIIAGWCT